jgi:hypothetical protein
MRQNQQNKNRMRGRSRKGPNPLTRTFESNGPDVKIRGTALHIAEKYTQLARDASSSGDRVMAENYLQHAEHYYRVIATAQAALQPATGFQREDAQDDAEDDLEPIGSDRFEPRQIDMRMPNGNGYNPQQQDRGDRDQSPPQHDRDRSERRERGEGGYGERQHGGQDRGERPHGGQDRGERQHGGQDRGERQHGGQDRRDRSNDRRQRFERGNFERRDRNDRGERGDSRPYEPRPVAAAGPQPMPLDAPQPDVAFPEPVAVAAPVVTTPLPEPVAAVAAPVSAPAAETPEGEEGAKTRRRRAPRARKADAEATAPEPTTAE